MRECKEHQEAKPSFERIVWLFPEWNSQLSEVFRQCAGSEKGNGQLREGAVISLLAG